MHAKGRGRPWRGIPTPQGPQTGPCTQNKRGAAMPEVSRGSDQAQKASRFYLDTPPARPDQGSRLKAQGSRLKAQGSRLKAQGSRLKAQGSRLKAQGSRLKAQGSRLKAQGSRLKAQGSRLKAQGSRLKAQGSRLKAQGSRGRWRHAAERAGAAARGPPRGASPHLILRGRSRHSTVRRHTPP